MINELNDVEDPNKQVDLLSSLDNGQVAFGTGLNIKIPLAKRTHFPNYKFWIDKGNNPMLVKAVLKQRWWWSRSTGQGDFNEDELNFIWTANRKNHLL